MSLASAVLASCGGLGAASPAPTALPPTATPTVDPAVLANRTATALAFATANARTLASMLTPTPATPTPNPAPSATPVPTVAPTASVVPMTSAATAAATPTPYVANFAAWPTATPTTNTPARVSYDPATKEYTIAITDPKWNQVYIQYVPQTVAFGDFTLDVDVRQIAGPPNANVGVVFGAQPKGSNDKTYSRYNALLIPEQQRAGVTYTDANGRRTLLGVQAAPVLKKDATNSLHLTRKGGRITIAVNGVHVGDYAAPDATSGAIGLTVTNPTNNSSAAGASAAFSNLHVMPVSS